MTQDAPPAFDEAVASMRLARVRSEITIGEAPSPARLAPFSFALTADLSLDGEEDVATGRFVLLHDPNGQEAWGGSFRLVTFVKADLDPEMTADPLLTAVGWSWLTDALADHGAVALMSSGTVTRVASESFGELGDREPAAEIEIRASWTPEGAIAAHFEAWCDLLSTCAGLPPLPPEVAPLQRRRQ
jgi:hypothetical protein